MEEAMSKSNVVINGDENGRVMVESFKERWAMDQVVEMPTLKWWRWRRRTWVASERPV